MLNKGSYHYLYFHFHDFLHWFTVSPWVGHLIFLGQPYKIKDTLWKKSSFHSRLSTPEHPGIQVCLTNVCVSEADTKWCLGQRLWFQKANINWFSSSPQSCLGKLRARHDCPDGSKGVQLLSCWGSALSRCPFTLEPMRSYPYWFQHSRTYRRWGLELILLP